MREGKTIAHTPAAAHILPEPARQQPSLVSSSSYLLQLREEVPALGWPRLRPSYSSGGAIGSSAGEPGGGEGARQKAAGTQASSSTATNISRVRASASAMMTSAGTVVPQVKNANKRHALPPLETCGAFRNLPCIVPERGPFCNLKAALAHASGLFVNTHLLSQYFLSAT